LSEKISAAQSVIGVMAEVGSVGKTGHNDHQNYNFRGVDAVLNAVGPALRKVGGFISPGVILDKQYERGVTSKGVGTVEVRLTVQYKWYGTDGGEPIVSEVASEATDTSDKATAKAMSVAYRTYLLQILTLPTGDRDPDADSIDRGVAEPEPVDPFLENDWLDTINAASTLGQLQAAWDGAGRAGVTRSAAIVAAKDARKKALA